MAARRFDSFAEFYLYYLSEHTNVVSRRLHFVGSSLVLGCVLAALLTRDAWWLLGAPLCGYGFAWAGHFFFEHNRPATFKHPRWSFIGDWVMWKEILTGKIKF